MRDALWITLSCFVVATLVDADQPAVSIILPNEGSRWRIDELISVSVRWPNLDEVSYQDLSISLIAGDQLDGAQTLQKICNPPFPCPAIKPDRSGTSGTSSISWILAPEVLAFGQATILVRAKWGTAGADIVDTLSETRTILIVCPDGSDPVNNACPTPCTGGQLPGSDGSCPTPSPDGSYPLPGRFCQVPSTPCPGGTQPASDGFCPTSCPSGQFPTDGVCEDDEDSLPCTLTQIGSVDLLCPQDGSRRICCGGACHEGAPDSHFCCSAGPVSLACPYGTNCCGASCCGVEQTCCGTTCCTADEECLGGECVAP